MPTKPALQAIGDARAIWVDYNQREHGVMGFGYEMPLTKDFRDTVIARAEHDPAFRAGLYREAVQTMLEGDFATGRILLRDFINATIGFTDLAQRVGITDKSLMRMFGPTGNPNATNLLAVLSALGADYRLSVAVETKKRKSSTSTGRKLAA